jgi:zinc finger HIT domain-containing protein 3
MLSYSCSLACSKKHRDEHPPEEETPASAAPANPFPATQQEPAQDGSEKPDEFNQLFRKYPNLSIQLLQVAEATDPPSVMTPSPEYGERLGPRRKKPVPWTKEIGMQNALTKLRQLRDEDDTGGIQEFCELIKIMKARDEDVGSGQAAAQQDADLIGQLIRDERD